MPEDRGALHCSLSIWLSAARAETEEIFKTPLNGEYIDEMMKIAAEAASAQMISVTTTVALRGANRPKLTKMATSHETTTASSGLGMDVCSDCRYINQLVSLSLRVADRSSALMTRCMSFCGVSCCNCA